MVESHHSELLLRTGPHEWNEWRKENPNVRPGLVEAELVAADLRGADLAQADLREADLTKADLRGADLSRADLSGADLYGALLSGARLLRTDLSGAVLTEADLSGANLRGALFDHTHLKSTNFTDATFAFTVLVDVDLSESRGLRDAHHAAPSRLGIDTLLRSEGRIADEFLRGAGIPETHVVALSALIAPPEFYSCFISYSSTDSAFASRLHQALRRRHISCWYDQEQIWAGEDILTAIDRGVRLWDMILLCCSNASLHSYWVDSELTFLQSKEQRLFRERGSKVPALIPIDLDGYLQNWLNPWAAILQARKIEDFIGWESLSDSEFEERVDKLTRALLTNAGGRTAPISKLLA